jgi:hypothetical protein
MKKNIILVSSLLLSSCYTRLGDLNLISNRNIDSSKEYVLVYRDAKSKSKIKDGLEKAIDDCTEKHKGEYMMNVKVYSNNNKIKIQGDVYAEKSSLAPAFNANDKISIGDRVTYLEKFSMKEVYIEGTVVGINGNGCIVEAILPNGRISKAQIEYSKLTKITK